MISKEYQDPPNPPQGIGLPKKVEGLALKNPFCSMGPRNPTEQVDNLQKKGFGACKLWGLSTICRVELEGLGSSVWGA